MKKLIVTALFFLLVTKLKSQNTFIQINGSQPNSSQTSAVPFLLIAPDARGNSLGDAGAATQPDVYSAHWNAAKLVSIEGDYGIGIGYVPWLRKIEPDIYLATVSGFKKVGSNSALAFSVYYFNLGQTIFRDESGYQNGVGYPNEFSLEATYSQKFGRNFSLGFTGKYIHSDLSNGQVFQGALLNPGNTAALDFSVYYRKLIENVNPRTFAFGMVLSNIGPKIAYGKDNKAFLPANLRIGFSYGINFNDLHQTNFSLDFNKLLVPNQLILDSSGKVISVVNSNVSALSGIISSFTNASGGFKQVIQEITISPGFEYIYDRTLSLRTGLFLENKNSGGRQYLNLGMGLKINSSFDFHISYLYNLNPISSLANTFRISLGAVL